MALPPTLSRSTEDEPQVKASFPGGRYRFSLTDTGRDLLCNDLELEDGATVPWTAFEILVVVGDAYLPNVAGTGIDVANDLAPIDRARELTGKEIAAITSYLDRGSYRDRELEALAEIVPNSSLATHISVDDLESKRDTVDGLRDIVARLDDTSPASEEIDPIRILHVGTATLGRRNLGRSVRQADYLDAFAQAIDIAVEAGVDAVIQTGQLFQRSSPKPRTIRDTREQLERLRNRGIPFYVTHSSNDRSTLDGHVPDLVDDGLVELIGGKTVSVDDEGTVCFHGVDAGLPRHQRTPAWDESSGAKPTFAGVVVEASSHPGTESVGVVAASIDTTPDAYFVGGIDERVVTTYGSTPVFGPGPTENTLGKRTVTGDDHPDRFVAVYTIVDGDIDATFHELEIRDHTSLVLECGAETDVDSLESDLSDVNVHDTATMVVLTGEKHEHSPSPDEVRAMLEDEAFCVRVWDERTERAVSPDESNSDDPADESDRGDGDLTSRSPTVLCVADLQLRDATIPELEQVLDVAEANEIDAIVHTGDLFATVSPSEGTIQAIERALARIREGSLRFCTIGGRRTVAGENDSLERLESAGVERLGTTPTDVGSIAVYGFDHTPGDVESRLRDEKFTWASGSSHSICCLNQSIWPAIGDRDRADVMAYEVTDAVEPYLDAIVAGGSRGDHEWFNDELIVTYPGTANPELLVDDQDAPVGIVFDGSDNRALRYASIPLDERATDDPVTIDVSWRVLGQGEPSGDPPTNPEPTGDTDADPDPTEEIRTASPLDDVRRLVATDWEVEPDKLDTTDLIDCYGLLSKAKSDLERQRKTVRDALISRTDPEESLTGQYATVDHTERTRRSLRDPDAVLDVIEQAGIDPANVRSLDVAKAREALEETGNSFDDALTTLLELAGVDPDDAASIDHEKVERVVGEHGIDPDAVFETVTSASIVRKSLEFSEEE